MKQSTNEKLSKAMMDMVKKFIIYQITCKNKVNIDDCVTWARHMCIIAGGTSFTEEDKVELQNAIASYKKVS
jgi:hypothetical protein